jgi:hypothetical protein
MYLLYKACEPGSPAGTSRVYNQSHNKFYFTFLARAHFSSSEAAGIWCLQSLPNCGCEHQFALKAKSKLKRHDPIYQFLGNVLREEGRPNTTCEPGGAAMANLGCRGAGRGLWAPEGL